MKMFLTTLMSLSFSMLLVSTPIMMGMLVMLAAAFLCLKISVISSSWLSLLVFIIYIGGVLVLFSYFLASQPNMMFNAKHPILVFLSMYTLISNTHIPLIPKQHNNTLVSLSDMISPNNMVMVLMIGLILLFILIVIVHLASIKEAPLRPYTSQVYTYVKTIDLTS